MSKIKLNPYVDLGLSDSSAAEQLNNASPPITPASPDTTGVTDLSNFLGSLDYVQSNTQQPEFLSDYSSVSTTQGYDMEAIFFVLTIVFFLICLGAFIFFALQYFQII